MTGISLPDWSQLKIHIYVVAANLSNLGPDASLYLWLFMILYDTLCNGNRVPHKNWNICVLETQEAAEHYLYRNGNQNRSSFITCVFETTAEKYPILLHDYEAIQFILNVFPSLELQRRLHLMKWILDVAKDTSTSASTSASSSSSSQIKQIQNQSRLLSAEEVDDRYEFVDRIGNEQQLQQQTSLAVSSDQQTNHSQTTSLPGSLCRSWKSNVNSNAQQANSSVASSLGQSSQHRLSDNMNRQQNDQQQSSQNQSTSSKQSQGKTMEDIHSKASHLSDEAYKSLLKKFGRT